LAINIHKNLDLEVLCGFSVFQETGLKRDALIFFLPRKILCVGWHMSVLLLKRFSRSGLLSCYKQKLPQRLWERFNGGIKREFIGITATLIAG
jgi:hypothetical protein